MIRKMGTLPLNFFHLRQKKFYQRQECAHHSLFSFLRIVTSIRAHSYDPERKIKKWMRSWLTFFLSLINNVGQHKERKGIQANIIKREKERYQPGSSFSFIQSSSSLFGALGCPFFFLKENEPQILDGWLKEKENEPLESWFASLESSLRSLTKK